MNVLMEWADCKQVKPFSGMDKILSNLFTTFLNLYLNYFNGNINAWKLLTINEKHLKMCTALLSNSAKKCIVKVGENTG